MADKKAAAEKTPAAKGVAAPRRKGGMKFIFVMIVFGSLVPFGAPTLLLCLGLIPTFVAMITDTDHQKSSAMTIGFMNLAGVLPFIVDLWMRGQSMDVALAIARQPTTWLIMFGSAAVGKLILYVVPPAVAMMTLTNLEHRLHILQDGLEQLKEVWGADVATARSIEQIRKSEGS